MAPPRSDDAPNRPAPSGRTGPQPNRRGAGSKRGRSGKTPPLPRAVARDSRVSRRARGFLAELWSHVPGWVFTVERIWKETRGLPAIEGREALYRTVNELRGVGYVVPAPAPNPTADPCYTLNRSAAPPDDGYGFVHVPWAVARDRRLSYRARGILIERLAEGATLGGLTAAVHHGGVAALAGRAPLEGVKACRTAVDELLTVGYTIRTRKRDDRGRLSWAMVYRSNTTPLLPGMDIDPEPATDPSPATDPDAPAPVDNSTAHIPAPTCEDPTSPQVSSTSPFPGVRSREHDVTCEDGAFPQVGANDPFPGAIGELPAKGSSEGEEMSGLPSARTAQVPDARAKSNPLRGNEDHSRSVQPSGRAPVPRDAWAALARLPRELRDGAPGWVRRELARRLGRLLDDGMTADAIAATAARVVAERPVSGDHIAVLRAVRARLVADLAAGDVCGPCGATLWVPHGRCPACDDHRPLTEAEQRQLAAARAHLGAPPDADLPPIRRAAA